MNHLYLCPVCNRSFDLANDEPIPEHPPCPYTGPGQRLTFTLDEARAGITVPILVTNAGPGQHPQMVYVKWQEKQ